MLRTATMGEPAHDGAILAQLLHSINAEIVIILPLIARPFCDDQGPRDQRCRLTGPAALDRQARQIDICAFPDHFLAGRFGKYPARNRVGPHLHDGLGQGQEVKRFLQAARWFWLTQKGQKFAYFAQVLRGPAILAVHGYAHSHPLDGAK